MALLVHPKHKLPTEDFEGLEDLANFERVVEKRYNDVGRPLTALSQEEIMRGYLSVVDKRVIPNLWDPRSDGLIERPWIDLTYADEVRVHNKFDPWTHVVVTKNGRESAMEDIAEELGPEAKLPGKKKEVWNMGGLGFEAKEKEVADTPARPPAKRAKAKDKQGAGQRSSPSALSQVLQHRLKHKLSPEKR